MLKGQVRVVMSNLVVPEDLKARIAERALSIAGRIADRARQSSAFSDDTGELRSSIDAVDHPELGVIVRARAPHAHLVEFGHDIVEHGRKLRVSKKDQAKGETPGQIVGHVRAYPFLRPAAEEEMGKVVEEFAYVIDDFLSRPGGIGM